MAKPGNQKLKLLYLLKLLEESDASHPVTMKRILEELQDRGIPAERKGIYDDLGALRDFGFSIVGKRGRSAGYYLEKGTGAEALFGTMAAAVPVKKAEPVKQAAEPEQTKVPSPYPWLSGNVNLELLCREDAASEILEELGEKASVRKKGKKKGGMTELKMKALPGPGFFGWLAGYGCRVRLTAPQQAVREYKKYLKEIRNMYKEEG